KTRNTACAKSTGTACRDSCSSGSCERQPPCSSFCPHPGGLVRQLPLEIPRYPHSLGRSLAQHGLHACFDGSRNVKGIVVKEKEGVRRHIVRCDDLEERFAVRLQE